MPLITDRRRFFLTALTIGVSSCGALSASEVPGVQIANLRDQLEKGLRARLPREFEFIDRVIKLVEINVLPLELVKSTFQWARENAKNKRYPFPYFEYALRLRAKKIGIAI